MLRIALPLVLVAFSCSKGGDGPKASPLHKAADLTLVNAETESFSYGCPQGWEIKPPKGKQVSLNCSTDGTMCFAMAEPGKAGESPAAYWKRAMAAQEKVMGPMKVDQESAHSANGVDFYRVIAEETMSVFYAFSSKGQAVTLACVAMGADLKATIPSYDAMAQSFRWK